MDGRQRRIALNEALFREVNERVRDVPVAVAERDDVVDRERLDERVAELPAGAGYDDAAAALSRLDRIGDLVLQRCLTRQSSHGISCSSGSCGSYSSVTW